MTASTVLERTVEEIVAGWRAGDSQAGPESPAGPLFTGGRYAEHELISPTPDSPQIPNCSAGTASCVFQSGIVLSCC